MKRKKEKASTKV